MTIESFPKKEGSKTEIYLKRLEDLELQLKKEIETLRGENIDAPISADEYASSQQDRVRREELLNNAKERLQEIEKTLVWVRENGFTCRVCGKDIEEGRLEADVASVTCKEHVDQEDDDFKIAA